MGWGRAAGVTTAAISVMTLDLIILWGMARIAVT
jgi:hypothetical protein